MSRQPGQPAAPAGSATASLLLRTTPETVDAVREAARAAGLTVAEWHRRAVQAAVDDCPCALHVAIREVLRDETAPGIAMSTEGLRILADQRMSGAPRGRAAPPT